MKKGFTLAEVLITLAIIGVVAALTIPTVIANYNQKAQYTAFMKSYNTLQNAFTLGMTQNGNPAINFDNATEKDYEDFFNDYFAKNLKVAASCKGNPDACVSANTPIRYLNGELIGENASLHGFAGAYPSVLLQDGSLVVYNHGDAYVAVDTNGGKAPNTFGRDLFLFEVKPVRLRSDSQEETWKFFPMMLYYGPGVQITLPQTIDITEIDKDSEELQAGKGASCSNESYSQGHLCGARLLLEGAMKY